MDVKDVIKIKVEHLKRTVGSGRVGVYGGESGLSDRNMKAILDGVDVAGVYVPSGPLAVGKPELRQVAEAKLAQLRGLQDKLLRFKQKAHGQNNGINIQKAEQLSQKVEGAITETELLRKLLSNAANDHGENICGWGCRVFTNLDEFLANTDVCLTWGKGGDYESILNRIKTAFPQSRLIDLFDGEDADSLTGFAKGRQDYIKLFRLTGQDRQLLSEKGYNAEYLKKTAMNIFKNSIQKRSIVGFTAIESFEHEKQLLAESGFDSGVIDFERSMPYFLQSMLKTGHAFSRCPVCGKACRTDQSFCMLTHPYHQLIFYRFSCCKTFYLIIGDSRQRKIGMYVPQDELMINFIYYEGENSASEEPYSRQHYMEWISDFKRHIIHSWDDVDPYTASPSKRNVCFTAFIANFGHHMTDEVAAIQHLYDVGDISNIDAFMVGGYDFFHIPRLFPQLPILNRHINYSTKSVDVFRMALKDNLFGFRPFFDGPFQEELAQNIHRMSREKCSQQFLELVNDSGKHHPLVWVTLRTHNRVWLSQKEGLANILNKLCEDFPNLGVIFDGTPRETQLMSEINALLDPGITVFNGLNCSKEQTIVWTHQIDFFIAPHAAGSNFTTIANKPGITHTHSKWAKNEPYHINRRENGALAYPIPVIRDEDNDDQFACNYEVGWKDIYDLTAKLIEMTEGRRVCLV